MNKLKLIIFIVISLTLNNKISDAQIFTRITTASNPIVSDPVQSSYAGASWIDYDNDGLLDLFVVRGGLYHNNGGGNFSKITNSNVGLTTGIGNTWADVDNDGDIDCLLSGGNAGGTRLYLNNGNGTFTQNVNDPFTVPTSLRGWGSAFGDYNNDGLVDIFIAAAYGFAGINDECKFLVNTGNGNFVRVDTTAVTDTIDAFTVPSWSDYDNDGDLDLFIGAGRVNGSLSRDYLFDNNFIQGGIDPFTRINSTPLGTDLHDGQIWNWIDYDNDGDLDAYLTNYNGTTPQTGYVNEMYRNDNGTFVKLNSTDVGPIVSDEGTSLSSTWGDFDNDGDLDCIVTNEANQQNAYYQNNIVQGSSVFTKITTEPFTNNMGNHYCATTGDYDKDGDLDLFISGNSDKGLFKNQTTFKNFVDLKLIGVTSNKSGIGAKVRAKANGFWQMREISSQNTFNGMNMLNAHFGFGNAGPLPITIDSIIIEWPSGLVDICTNIISNNFYDAVEGQCLSFTGINDFKNSGTNFLLQNIYPNPAKDVLTLNYIASGISQIHLSILDVSGRNVIDINFTSDRSGTNYEKIDLKKIASGFYTVILSNGTASSKGNFIKQ